MTGSLHWLDTYIGGTSAKVFPAKFGNVIVTTNAYPLISWPIFDIIKTVGSPCSMVNEGDLYITGREFQSGRKKEVYIFQNTF